jgi:hypothetical protein
MEIRSLPPGRKPPYPIRTCSVQHATTGVDGDGVVRGGHHEPSDPSGCVADASHLAPGACSGTPTEPRNRARARSLSIGVGCASFLNACHFGNRGTGSRTGLARAACVAARATPWHVYYLCHIGGFTGPLAVRSRINGAYPVGNGLRYDGHGIVASRLRPASSGSGLGSRAGSRVRPKVHTRHITLGRALSMEVRLRRLRKRLRSNRFHALEHRALIVDGGRVGCPCTRAGLSAITSETRDLAGHEDVQYQPRDRPKGSRDRQ